MASPIQWTYNLGKTPADGEGQGSLRAAVPGAAKSLTALGD